jgi:hypothetical protein
MCAKRIDLEGKTCVIAGCAAVYDLARGERKPSCTPEVADLSGGYFFKCPASAPAPQAEDDNAAKRLWRESAKLASIE